MPIGSSFLDANLPVPGVDAAGLGMMAGQNGAAIAQQLRKRGFFDRIGDFVNSPEGRGALLRSGAATLQGGLGSGIMAGANWVDQQHDRRDKEAEVAADEALKNRGLDINQQHEQNTAQYQQGQLGLGLGELEERGRSNRAGEALTARGQNVQTRGQDLGAQTAVRGQDVERAGQLTSAGTARDVAGLESGTQRDIAGQRDRLERDSWSQNPAIVAAGIGSKVGGTRETTTKVPGVHHLFSPDTPDTITRTTEVMPPPPAMMSVLGGGPAPAVEPMPATQDQAQVNHVYQTSRGPARWTGTQFELLK